jgi:hypothetical protein
VKKICVEFVGELAASVSSVVHDLLGAPVPQVCVASHVPSSGPAFLELVQ